VSHSRRMDLVLGPRPNDAYAQAVSSTIRTSLRMLLSPDEEQRNASAARTSQLSILCMRGALGDTLGLMPLPRDGITASGSAHAVGSSRPTGMSKEHGPTSGDQPRQRKSESQIRARLCP
jgi:hypothetical protein